MLQPMRQNALMQIMQMQFFTIKSIFNR